MKIGFLSDTHGDYDQTMKALDLLKDCDKVYHLGDVLYHGPRNDLPKGYNPKKLAEVLKGLDYISYIKGNCDSDVDQMVIGKDLQQKKRIEEIEAARFLMVHGYEETEEERIKEAKELGAKVIVTGHTHVKVLEEKEGIILLNPGSPSIPKDGSASVATYDKGVFTLRDLDGNKLRDKK